MSNSDQQTKMKPMSIDNHVCFCLFCFFSAPVVSAPSLQQEARDKGLTVKVEGDGLIIQLDSDQMREFLAWKSAKKTE